METIHAFAKICLHGLLAISAFHTLIDNLMGGKRQAAYLGEALALPLPLGIHQMVLAFAAHGHNLPEQLPDVVTVLFLLCAGFDSLEFLLFPHLVQHRHPHRKLVAGYLRGTPHPLLIEGDHLPVYLVNLLTD